MTILHSARRRLLAATLLTCAMVQAPQAAAQSSTPYAYIEPTSSSSSEPVYLSSDRDSVRTFADSPTARHPGQLVLSFDLDPLAYNRLYDATSSDPNIVSWARTVVSGGHPTERVVCNQTNYVFPARTAVGYPNCTGHNLLQWPNLALIAAVGSVDRPTQEAAVIGSIDSFSVDHRQPQQQ
ncbi:hypothetical protein C1Y63_09755 [Corynebacterium sp. 13CS0277]|uniref:hypothetical protein n=1 Tax=Corynebacterium sp. 13CS0277 TaxID=2071994 RepID=UPI000D023CC2|nr:hypothetical protein [Corynebacterium sp. 13CS0277]PRQ10735.1 hypothetical protein C1Y63_09755 [Corynebacterium sp. 13CS0277]